MNERPVRAPRADSREIAELKQLKISNPELIAAKLCGRWRNGVPLALSPSTPDTELPFEKYNAFDYAPTAEVPDAYDDLAVTVVVEVADRGRAVDRGR